MTVCEAEAQMLATRAFVNAGVPERQAADAAEVLTLAEMMGIGTHGLSRVRVYRDRIAAGGTNPSAVAIVDAPAPGLRRVDGRNGLGPAVARRALGEAMAAARSVGIGAAFCRGGGHLGALAPFLWLAAESGFACIMTTNTAPMIAPAGGREARIGNNPLGIAIPHPGGGHVLLDMALSVVSRSRVRAAAQEGRAIPADWATDAEGRPTTDPAEAMHGLMRAIGGDKGANLALCLDLLAGGLSGAAMLTAIPNAGTDPGAAQDLGTMIVLMDTRRLLPDENRAAVMDRAGHVIAGTAPVDPGSPVRLPGSRAIAALQRARKDGLSLSPQLLDDLRTLAG